MGYSVATPIVSPRLHERMLAFLRDNFRTYDALGGRGGYISAPTADLAYDSSRQRIGFDYNAVGVERDYAFALCRWMALRVGRKQRFERLLPGRGPFPYIRYDGCESIPVVRSTTRLPATMRRQVSVVDDYGFCVGDFAQGELRLASLLGELEMVEAVRKEVRRLDDLWQGRPATGP